MRHARWTKNDDILLKRLYHDGKTRKEIAEIMGIKRVRVNSRAAVLKLPAQRQAIDSIKPVLSMLKAGYSVADVALTFGITQLRVIEIKKHANREAMR